MEKKLVLILCGVGVLLLFIALVREIYATNGGITIYGKVLSETNTPLKGLEVSISSADKRFPGIRTNENGEYRFEGLLPDLYYVYIYNHKPDAIYILSDKHVCIDPDNSPYLYKSIELKESDTAVEVNFQLTLGVKVAGQITYEDDTPATTVAMEIPNGWGRVSVKDGLYQAKGLLVENNSVKLVIHYDHSFVLELPTWHVVSQTITIPAQPGDTITRDIKIRKIDPTKISLKGNVYVENVLYAPANKDILEGKKVPSDSTPVYVGAISQDGAYSYATFMLEGGKYECYDILSGGYKFAAVYHVRDFLTKKEIPYRRGPITGETDVEIPAEGTVTIDINFVVSPTERVEFIKR